jgi:hypothetical protein
MSQQAAVGQRPAAAGREGAQKPGYFHCGGSKPTKGYKSSISKIANDTFNTGKNKCAALGWYFLFDRNLFLGHKNSKKRIPEDFFFSCVFRRIFSQERGFGGCLRNSCFLPLSQDFFAGIPAGQEFLRLQRIPPDSFGFLWIPPNSSGFLRIPPDSSGFLFPPNAVLLWPATKVGFLLSKYRLK